MTRVQKRELFILWIIIAIGCLLRLTLSLTARQDLTPFDEKDWFHRGLIFSRAHITAAWRPPVNTMLIGLLMRASDYHFEVTRLGYALLSCAVLPMVFLLARRFTDFRTSLITLIIVAFWPEFFSHSVLMMSEGPGITFITAAVLVTVIALQKSRDAKKPQIWVFFAAGLLWGLASLTREVMFYSALALFIPIWMCVKHKRKTLLSYAVLIMGLFVVILPNTLFNYRNHKCFILITNNGPYNLWKSWTKLSVAEVNRQFWSWPVKERQSRSMKKALECLKANPGHVVRNFIGNLNHFLEPDVYMMELFYYRLIGHGKPLTPLFWAIIVVVLLVPTMAGFFLFVSTRWKKGEALMLALIVFLSLCLHAVVYGQGRYRTPLMPFIIIGTVIGWKAVLQNFKAIKKKFFICLGITILIYIISTPSIIRRVSWEHKFHLKYRVNALKRNRLREALITHYRHSISLYRRRIEILKRHPPD